MSSSDLNPVRYPETGPTPEPVLRSAAVQSTVTGITAVGIALGAVLAPGTDLTEVQSAVLVTSAAIVALVNVVVTAFTAWKARQSVTPIAL